MSRENHGEVIEKFTPLQFSNNSWNVSEEEK